MEVPDKIRIKKRQKLKIEEWCKALDIPASRFIEDAIDAYLKLLDGKYPTVPDFLPQAPLTLTTAETKQSIDDVDDIEDFDGGINL